ncbi:MAG: D-2-hydroxyacid dehydrogenase [Acidobacteriota bacterium]|nr:D-2-hydroxyacid dehydrogenase [Acidobacteriota bacterium]
MDPIHCVIISNPAVGPLRFAEKLPPSTNLVMSNDRADLERHIPEADVLVNAAFSGEPFRSVFPSGKKLKWVHSLSAGVENILSPELIESPVPLTNGRGVFRRSLSEFAIGAMLFFAKDLRRMLRNQEAGKWAPFDIEMLEGKTLGIVGYGEIGQSTAKLARAFGMQVLAIRRRTALSTDDPNLDAVFAPEQLEDMLAASDFLLIAAPNTPDTRGMIGEPELNYMKSSAVIINVGRGPVIVETALVQALENKRIRGAALDVFDHEPLPAGHPFYSLDNVLLSPHCADHTVGWVELAVDLFIENFKLFEAGQPLKNIVDKKAGY